MEEGTTPVSRNAHNIAAGIVTFNAELSIFTANLTQISSQVQHVYVFDNGSDNATALQDVCKTFPFVELHLSPINLGIAAALNKIAAIALERNHRWLVTLDQDSIPCTSMVEQLSNEIPSGAALITPYVVDRNKVGMETASRSPGNSTVSFSRAASKGAITSGGLLNLEILRRIGGFDEEFFIDYVDYDLNARLLQCGYSIIRANGALLSHEVGVARSTWL